MTVISKKRTQTACNDSLVPSLPLETKILLILVKN